MLVGGGVFAPGVAEVDVDPLHRILRRDHAPDALDVGAHDLYIVHRTAGSGVGSLDLALGQDQHLVGDVDAQVVVLRVGAGQLGDKAALAAAQLQDKGLLGPGVQLVQPRPWGQRLVDVEITGHQLGAGIGFETHSHGIGTPCWFWCDEKTVVQSARCWRIKADTCSGLAAQLP